MLLIMLMALDGSMASATRVRTPGAMSFRRTEMIRGCGAPVVLYTRFSS